MGWGVGSALLLLLLVVGWGVDPGGMVRRMGRVGLVGRGGEVAGPGLGHCPRPCDMWGAGWHLCGAGCCRGSW